MCNKTAQILSENKSRPQLLTKTECHIIFCTEPNVYNILNIKKLLNVATLLFHCTHNETISLSPTQSDHMTGKNTFKEVWINSFHQWCIYAFESVEPMGCCWRECAGGAREKIFLK